MRKWCVVALKPDEEVAVRYSQSTLDRRVQGIYNTVVVNNTVNPFDAPLASGLQVFFVDTEEEAGHLQAALASRNSGIEYGVAQMQSVALSSPAKPIVSKFTEKGLMPV